MTTILAIDPSVNNVGVALLQKGNGIVKWDTRLIQPDCDGLVYRTDQILKTIPRFCLDHGVGYRDMTNLVMEYPTFMGGTKGLIAAQEGYTIDLAFVLGTIRGIFIPIIASPNIFLYTPRQWKGQKPKSATKAQHKRIFGFDLDSPDECDAKMMLYFHAKKYELL